MSQVATADRPTAGPWFSLSQPVSIQSTHLARQAASQNLREQPWKLPHEASSEHNRDSHGAETLFSHSWLPLSVDIKSRTKNNKTTCKAQQTEHHLRVRLSQGALPRAPCPSLTVSHSSPLPLSAPLVHQPSSYLCSCPGGCSSVSAGCRAAPVAKQRRRISYVGCSSSVPPQPSSGAIEGRGSGQGVVSMAKDSYGLCPHVLLTPQVRSAHEHRAAGQ